MTHRIAKHTSLILLSLALVACDRDAPAPADATGEPAATPAPPAAQPSPGPVELADESEITSGYIIGITYPQSANRYPALAAELKRYADAARTELMRAVEARGDDPAAGEGGPALYDLSLAFTEILDTPALLAYAADGSMYTGGAHGMPLIERFVWLPGEERRLTAAMLVPDSDGWAAIARHVREQLHTRLSQQADEQELEPAERASLTRSGAKMIDAGTAPDPENFDQFEPVAGDDGRIVALRFVFPPYQVGPYSEGTQVVQVPAMVLLPHVAPEYRDLFDATATPPPAPVIIQDQGPDAMPDEEGTP